MSRSAPRLNMVGITWPIFVENLFMALIGLLGLWMASRLSDGAVATYGVANQIVGALQIVFRVASIGTSVVVTQHHGAGDRIGAGRVALAGLSAAVWVGIVTALLVGLGATQILTALHLPGELFVLGVPYLGLLAFALAVDSVAMTMIAVLRAYTYTRVSMRIVLLMNIVQVLMGFPLMFGVGGWDGFGLTGLAIAMIASRLIALALLWQGWRNKLGVRPGIVDCFRPDGRSLKSILHIGLPGAGEKVAYRVSFIMTVAMVGSMGAAALATHTYVWQSVQLVTLFVNSVGFGTEIVIGHLVGAGRFKEANRLMLRAVAWGFCVMFLCALASFFITPAAVAHVSRDPQIIALVGTIVWIELVLEPGRSLNTIITSGLRASGDARFPVKISAVSVFVFGAGLGWLLGVHFGLGLPGIWLGYMADEWARGLCMAARWYWLGWAPYARGTRRRILSHRARA
ncbi:MAG: MATE family efflux transporter [Rhodocyclaceae bacterium]